MSEPEFSKSCDGLIHLVNPIAAEYTVCGDAFEGNPGDDVSWAWGPTRKTKVTCPKCLEIIRACKKVRI